jgi:hypothetical protein
VHLFGREKLSKTHAFSLQSTQKVIEKVRFSTKDANWNSSNMKKRAHFSGIKI